MARVTEVTLVDDLDGGKADETVSFALDGKSFEIDLSAEHAAQLRDAIAPYVGAARRTSAGGRRQSVAPETAAPAKSREENAAIREWAKANGFDVSERGRLRSDVVQAYAERDRTPEPVAEEKPKRRSRKKATEAA
uniref:histone-like nucleoid-structuring protein Lsr2 n=1 Tax=Pseudonocardia pini TaxID=2758030 RepID=UPI0015F05811|nr:Lsr2 family protein [Pseudonocardia pini]